jgi:hypothetical protein
MISITTSFAVGLLTITGGIVGLLLIAILISSKK